MSDGPHRSLPLRPHWKKFAARAATPVYSLADVAEAFPFALKQDFPKPLLLRIRNILEGRNLFHEACEAELEGVRASCEGSAAGNALVDCDAWEHQQK